MVDKTAITFGLQATPAKPVPSDWRAWRVDRVFPKRNVAEHEKNWEQRGVDVVSAETGQGIIVCSDRPLNFVFHNIFILFFHHIE